MNPETATEKGYYFTSTIQVVGASPIVNGETTDTSGFGMTAPDERTVIVAMDNPAPHILELMGSFQMTPLHGPSFAEFGAGVFVDPAHVVSNGAYVIKEIVPQRPTRTIGTRPMFRSRRSSTM